MGIGNQAVGELDQLLPEIYDELRRMAAAHMRGQRGSHTLQPTALVHEVYLKLARRPELRVEDRRQFFALAGKAMRQVLVDHARARGRGKRGAEPLRVTLAEGVAASPSDTFDLIQLGDALEKLEKLDERQVRVVELRFLSGLSVEEVGEILGISATLVKKETALARAWLIRELS